jgi:hypothetical protein
MKLLVIPFRVKEINCTAAKADLWARVVTTFFFQELYCLIKGLGGYFKGLMGNAVFLESIAIKLARALKKHHVHIAALETH